MDEKQVVAFQHLFSFMTPNSGAGFLPDSYETDTEVWL